MFDFDSPRKRTLTGTKKDILWIKAGRKCEACGCSIKSSFDGHVGHKTAYSSGGSTHEKNLVMLCMICNKNQGTSKWIKFLEKYSKIEPRKYKKAYIKCIKEKKKSEVEKVNKQISKIRIALHKTNAKAKQRTLNNKLEKLRKELLIINEKYKFILGSSKTTTTKKTTKKAIKKSVVKKRKKKKVTKKSTTKKKVPKKKKVVKKSTTKKKKPTKKRRSSSYGWGWIYP